MRIHRLPVSAAAIAFAGVGLVAAGPAPIAHAAASWVFETASPLPISFYGGMVVDDAAGHIFVSGGASGIEVAGLNGQVQGAIPGTAGATGIALSSDGGTLYTALSSQNELAAINTSTLQVTKTYPTGTSSDPEWLTVAAGKVWFTTTARALNQLDPATGTISSTPADAFLASAKLFSSSSAPGVLVSASVSEPSEVEVYNISGTTPTFVRSVFASSFCAGASQSVAFAPNSADLLFACGAPYVVTEVKLSDFSTVRSFSTGPYPGAVAVSPDGQIAIGIMHGTGTAEIDVVSSGGAFNPPTYPENHFGVPGVAWGSGNTLYAVTSDLSTGPGSGWTYALHAFLPAIVTLSGPSSASHGSTVTFTGKVITTTALDADATVSVTRVDPAHPTGIAVGTLPVGSDGAFSFTDTAAVLGTSTYTVTAGGATGPSLASATLWVHPPVYPWGPGHRSPAPTGSSKVSGTAVRH
ncbi:MAG TPA: hypothetical protein VFU74_13440 [Actinocrinis sp.]|nr:hypothetical protein [Actinocrinis sp.]